MTLLTGKGKKGPGGLTQSLVRACYVWVFLCSFTHWWASSGYLVLPLIVRAVSNIGVHGALQWPKWISFLELKIHSVQICLLFCIVWSLDQLFGMVHWAAPWEREKEKHVCNHALSLLHQPQVRKQWKRVCLSGWLTQVQSASTSVILREADLSACCFSWSSFLWPGFSGCTVQLVPELHRVEGRHEWSQGQSQGSRAPPSAYPWVQAVT